MLEPNDFKLPSWENPSKRSISSEKPVQKSFESETDKHQDDVKVFQDIPFSYSKSTRTISDSLTREHESAQQKKKKIQENIQNVQQKIIEIKTNRNNYQAEMSAKLLKMQRDMEKMRADKEKEINRLQDEIKYKEDVTEFFKRLSFVEVLEMGEVLKFKVKYSRDEHIFTITAEDNDSFSYELVKCTQKPEDIPDFLKETITFKKEQCPHLFLKIFESISTES